MEKELNRILDQIEAFYYDEQVSTKQKELTELWTKYYQLAASYQLELPRAYDLYLLGENLAYVIPAEVDYEPNLMLPSSIIEKLQECIVENQLHNTLVQGLTMEEANHLLRYVVNLCRKYFASFGIDVYRNSFSGYCEVGQVATIYPLEKLGLPVTKNTAEDSFGYLFHHAFGTVEIPIQEESGVTNQTFLMDSTYKQFFTVVRCNHGRYYAKDEITNQIVAPDPGYFMKTQQEKEICSKLIYQGYLPLTLEVAKVYGSGFQKASVSLENFQYYDKISAFTGEDYRKKINHSKKDYEMSLEELEDYPTDLSTKNFKK